MLKPHAATGVDDIASREEKRKKEREEAEITPAALDTLFTGVEVQATVAAAERTRARANDR